MNDAVLSYEFLERRGDDAVVTCLMLVPVGKDPAVETEIGGDVRTRDLRKVGVPDENGRQPYSFSFVIDASEADGVVDIRLKLDGERRVFSVGVGRRFPLDLVNRASYCRVGGRLFRLSGGRLSFRRVGWFGCLAAEIGFAFGAMLSACGPVEIVKAPIAVLARWWILLRRKLQRRPLWIVMDRADRAGDNGEAFFRYLNERHPEIRSVFAISAKCRDYRRMAEVGEVYDYDRPSFRLLRSRADVVISSQIRGMQFCSTSAYYGCFRNLFVKTVFVFLQHGVILHDLSSWLSKYKNRLHGFVTSAVPEDRSICSDAYGYDRDEVWGTCLPRFDRLYHAEENVILLMPTWRHELVDEYNPKTATWDEKGDFSQTAYCDFYNRLIRDERLNVLLKERNYRLLFCLHPNFRQFASRFAPTENVIMADDAMEYRDIFARSRMVITDYSSAVFDFAYMRKPIVYSQFDRDTYFQGSLSIQEGYFDYARDGFGELESTVDGVVDRIREYMDRDFAMKPEYAARIKGFFLHEDAHCCERVYELIIRSERRMGL